MRACTHARVHSRSEQSTCCFGRPPGGYYELRENVCLLDGDTSGNVKSSVVSQVQEMPCLLHALRVVVRQEDPHRSRVACLRGGGWPAWHPRPGGLVACS